MSETSMIKDAPRVGNPTQAKLCILILDTSGSMEGDPIQGCKEGLDLFVKEIADNEMASNAVDFLLITFDSAVKEQYGFAPVTREAKQQIGSIVLAAQGTTAMHKALNTAYDRLSQRRAAFDKDKISYHRRARIFLITDGEPDDLQAALAAAKRFHDEEVNGNCYFRIIGVGNDVNEQTLQDLTTPGVDMQHLNGPNTRSDIEKALAFASAGMIANAAPGQIAT